MRVSKKITLLFMSPDGTTRRFNLSRWFIAVMVLALLALPIAGGFGAAIGWDAWNSRQDWQRERKALHDRLDAHSREIARLEHVADQAQKDAEAARAQAARQAPERKGLADMYTAGIDKDIIRIENPVFRKTDDRTLRLIMEMYSVTPPSPISGRVMYSLLTTSGNVVPLSHGDTLFRIIRFKKFMVNATIPPTTLNLEGASVVLEVLTSGSVIFRKVYPLQK